jgi:hypothetical protein
MSNQQQAEAIINSWFLGKTSKHFESGDGGPATISSGHGDHGGVSYGSYQLSTAMGTVQEFLTATHNYNGAFNGLTPNTSAFNQKWIEVARHDPNFGEAQHQFIAKNHYEPILKEINEKGYDFSNRGLAVQDLIWSTAVQYRHNAPDHIKRAEHESGVSFATATDEQLINIIQADKLTHHQTDFRSSRSQWHGITERMVHEKEALLTILHAEQQYPDLAREKLRHSENTHDSSQLINNTHAAAQLSPACQAHFDNCEAKTRELYASKGFDYDKQNGATCALGIAKLAADRNIIPIEFIGSNDGTISIGNRAANGAPNYASAPSPQIMSTSREEAVTSTLAAVAPAQTVAMAEPTQDLNQSKSRSIG